MIDAFILFLPASVCLFWLLLYPLTIPKAATLKSLLYLTAVATLFFLADSCYASPLATSRTLTITSLITQLSAPSIIPLLLIYLRKIGNNDQLKNIHLIWVLVPIVLFTVELMLVVIYGIDNIANYLNDFYTKGISVADINSGYAYHNYYLWAIAIFRIVMTVEILIILMNFIMLLRHRGLPLRYLPAFLFRKGSIRVLGLSYAALSIIFFILLLKAFIFRNYLLAHQWLPLTFAVLLSILLFVFLFFGLFSSRKTITLAEMKKCFVFDDPDKQNTHEKKSSAVSVVTTASTGDKESDSLLNKFKRIFINQEMFLEPRITVLEVADRLGTNKTYISKMVNSAYGMSFPDLINSLRIEYTQRYIINHRNATQADIARKCGFTSASALNNTFKKVTGMTPKIWLATQDRIHNS